MKKVLIPLIGVLLFSVCGKNIIVEAESLNGKKAVRNRSGYSANAFCGKWKRLNGSVNIPESGIWYVWVRYCHSWKQWESRFGALNAKKLRSFQLTAGKNTLLFETSTNTPWGWGRRRISLPKGKIPLTLSAVGGDPYVDVMIFTRNPAFIPKLNYSKIPDEITGAVKIPKTRFSLKIPRSSTFAESSPFVIRSGDKARTKTTALLRHDGRTLFAKIRCMQKKSSLKIHKGAPWKQDSVEFVLDGNRSLNTIRHIIITPDNRIFSTKNGMPWQCSWRRKAEIKNDYWSVELEIPLVDLLDTLPTFPGRMRANFCRQLQDHGEYSSWVPFGKGFTDPATCGELLFENMAPDEWNALFLEKLNSQALALDEKALTGKITPERLLQFEQKLENIIRKKFAPPAGTEMVFNGTNLLPNPDFEYGRVCNGAVLPLNWNMTGTGRVVIASGSQKGKHALRIDTTGKNFKLHSETKPYIDSTLEYEWSGFFKSDIPGNKLILKVIWYLLDFDAEGSWGNTKKHSVSQMVITPGKKWQKYTMKVRPPRGAVNCEFEIIIPDCKGQLWCDTFSFDGMGAAETEFLLPQPGFDAQATKKAVIWSKIPLKGNVRLYSDKKKIASVKPVQYGKSRWKGTAYYADFTTVKTPGTYHLDCSTAKGITRSHTFSIEKDLYMRLAKFATQFYFIQRQGVDVPGWHKANFLDDAVVVDKKSGKVTGHRDVSGGWQDAGDPSKQAPVDLSIFGLSEFFENTQCVEYKLKEKYPDILALAYPEVHRQINKCYVGNGLFMGVAVNNINNVHYHIKNADPGKFRTRSIHKKTPENWTDNIPGTWDDRYISSTPGLQWMVSGLSKFALSVKKYDPEVAKKITQVISEDYPVRQARQSVWKKRPLERVARGDGELAKISMHLYLLTGKEKYRNDCEGYIREILKVYQAKYYRTDKKIQLNSEQERYNYFNQTMTLFDYLRYLPSGQHRAAVKKALKDITDYIFTRSLDNEFGIVTHLYTGPGFRLRAPDWYNEDNGSNRRIARLAYLAVRAARLFKEPRYLAYGDYAAQFILGRNPKNTSMLIGNGWKFAATATTLRFCDGHQDGVLPGAVIRGMLSMPGTPPDFPALNVSSNPGGCAKGSMHEVWQEDTNAFILLCQELAMARKEMGEIKK